MVRKYFGLHINIVGVVIVQSSTWTNTIYYPGTESFVETFALTWTSLWKWMVVMQDYISLTYKYGFEFDLQSLIYN